MLRNYFRVAARTLRRYPGFTAINIAGLGISMAVGLLLILFIRDQSSKDGFHADADRIYRVYSDFKASFNQDNDLYATSPADLSTILEQEVPGVEKGVKLRSGFNGTIVYKDTGLPIAGLYADPAFFDIFSFTLKAGNSETALLDPNSVVLSPATAERFFGTADPLGETITVEGGSSFTVTGILARDDYPSHIPLTAIASYATLESDPETAAMLDDWTRSIYRSYTYVRLDELTSSRLLQDRIDQLIPQHYADRDENRLLALRLQPLGSINLGIAMGNEIGVVLPRIVAYFLSGLALIILLTACFNYVGLSVSRSLRRSREVGVRKMFGAKRSQIFGQFLVEALLVAGAAVVFATVLLQWLVPAFNSMMFVSQTGASLSVDFGSDPGILGVLILFTLVIALIAGVYPAAYLSRFEPAKAVKGITEIGGRGGSRLRKALVVVQFTLSIVFIVVTTTMFRQSAFMINADYGFEQKDIVNVRLFSVPYPTFRQELESSSNIVRVSGTSPLPAMGSRRDRWLRSTAAAEPIKGYIYYIDEYFLENLGLTLLSGRNVSPDIASDGSRTVLVNETFVRRLDLGSPDDAIGKTFIEGDSTDMEIAGVVRDYQADLLSEETRPNFLLYAPQLTDWANVRIAPGKYDQAVADIRAAWTRLGSARAVELDRFDLQLKNNFSNLVLKDALKLVGFIAILAIVIACLGLLGIATYNVERRTREISIRKVLGATSGSVVSLLSREFLILMGISLLIALPGSWLLSSTFLQTYARRVDLGAGTLVFAVGVIFSLALAVISTQTYRAAIENPVDNLHDD